jgi:hypothetical protein
MDDSTKLKIAAKTLKLTKDFSKKLIERQTIPECINADDITVTAGILIRILAEELTLLEIKLKQIF